VSVVRGGASRPAPVVSPTSRARFGRQQRRTRLHRWRTPGMVLLAVAVVAGSGWLLGWSSLLSLAEVEVRGGAPSVQRTVIAVVADSGVAGVGTPLARVDTAAVEAQVARVPASRSARVRRGWPHTLVVEVVARRPAAALTSGAAYRLVDRDGVVFGSAAQRPAGVPVLDADAGLDAAPARAAAVAVLAALPRPLRADVTKVVARTPDDISFRLRRGDSRVTVVWGSDARTARKARVLGALLRQDAEVYDVSAPDRPTIRPTD
jgi:cell division protein FtsQ